MITLRNTCYHSFQDVIKKNSFNKPIHFHSKHYFIHYNYLWVGKNVSDRFPIRNGLKQEDGLTPLLFNFALEYAIRRGQVNQDGLKLNGTHQLLSNADDVNILGGGIHTLKENAEALVAATRKI